MSAPEPGDLAPDFTLPGTSPEGSRDYTLSSVRGRPVVLAFYPGDDTPVCTRQLCSYQSDLAALQSLGAELWGISTQDIASHERFAAKRGLTFPLLADVDGAVHDLYSAGGFLLSKRAVYVVDGAGHVAWRHLSRTGLTYQGMETIAGVLRGLGSYPDEPRSGDRSVRRTSD